MIAFVDSSVILRLLFGEPHPLAEWPRLDNACASRLLPVEVGRVIDRARLEGRITDSEVADLHEEARRLLRSMDVFAVTEEILDAAAGAMPTVLGTLDAIHLATAVHLARSVDEPLLFATHDAQLARGARASGLDVCGV